MFLEIHVLTTPNIKAPQNVKKSKEKGKTIFKV